MDPHGYSEHESDMDNEESVVPSEATPGRWYYSPKWGRVLCCGTSEPGVWIPAFAIHEVNGKTRLRFLTDDCPLTNSPQGWD